MRNISLGSLSILQLHLIDDQQGSLFVSVEALRAAAVSEASACPAGMQHGFTDLNLGQTF